MSITVRRAVAEDSEGVIALARSFGTTGGATYSGMTATFHRLVAASQ